MTNISPMKSSIYRDNIIAHCNNLDNQRKEKVQTCNYINSQVKNIGNAVVVIVCELLEKNCDKISNTELNKLINNIDDKKNGIAEALNTCKNVEANTELRLKGNKLKALNSGCFKRIIHGDRYKKEANEAKARFSTGDNSVTKKILTEQMKSMEGTIKNLKDLQCDMLFLKKNLKCEANGINEIEKKINKASRELKRIEAGCIPKVLRFADDAGKNLCQIKEFIPNSKDD